MDFITRLIIILLFVMVFILPMVHIVTLDSKGKVRPFDQDKDSR